MKDVLIVCYGMGCGGAEKSLISFLNRLPKDRWNVDLIVANPNGMYMKQIPSTVREKMGIIGKASAKAQKKI